MLQDFNSSRVLEEYRESERVKDELERTIEELKKIYQSLQVKTSTREGLEGQRQKALVTRYRIGLLSRIASIFHRGKYYEETQGIKATEVSLKRLTKECEQLEVRKEELSAKTEKLEAKEKASSMPECISERDGRLAITDEAAIRGIRFRETQTESLDSSKKVLVHCTNFFPKDNVILSNYDGNKIGTTTVEYRGVKKETSALIHRHEVHCTINARVENTGAGEGKWDNPTYMIVDRYDAHQSEMESTSASDAWTKGTSMQLSDDSVIMVRYQDRDKLPIPQEERDKYHIIYYDGDPTTCLKNFLKLNDYYILETDANNAGHADSTRMKQEDGCNGRDLAINFIRGNSYFLKQSQSFDSEEIAQIVEVAVNSNLRNKYNLLSYDQEIQLMSDNESTEDKTEQYSRVASFVIASGLIKTEDGNYTFKSDEEILEDIDGIEKDKMNLPDFVNNDLIDEIFEMQQQVEREYEESELPAIKEYSSMTLEELYKFENQLECEAVLRTLPEEIEMVHTNEEILLRLYLNDEDYPAVKRSTRLEDGIELEDSSFIDDNSGKINLKITGDTTIAEINGIISDTIKRIKEIKSREVERNNEHDEQCDEETR